MKLALDEEDSPDSAIAFEELLSDNPKHFGGCCPGVSKPLIDVLLDRLPQDEALILSVGSGSGLFEAIMLDIAQRNRGRTLNLRGIEVPPCLNMHLREDRVLRVPCSNSLHPDAFLASAWMFVYPRKASLVARYLDAFMDGAVEMVVWLGHRNDWAEMEMLLIPAFMKLECIDGPGIPEYEMLAVASMPRRMTKQQTTVSRV